MYVLRLLPVIQCAMLKSYVESGVTFWATVKSWEPAWGQDYGRLIIMMMRSYMNSEDDAECD